jgi:hypothetical protein
MSTAEINTLKLNLIAWINQLSDAEMLSFLHGVKESKTEEDWWDSTHADHKAMILQGLQDIGEGKTVSPAEFWSSIKDA